MRRVPARRRDLSLNAPVCSRQTASTGGGLA
jgi:hypothetical protein